MRWISVEIWTCASFLVITKFDNVMKKSLKQILALGVIFCLLTLMFPTQSDGIDMVQNFKTKVNKDRNHSANADVSIEENGGSIELSLNTTTKISYYCKPRKNRECPKSFLKADTALEVE